MGIYFDRGGISRFATTRGSSSYPVVFQLFINSCW